MTIALAVTRKFPWASVAPYVVAQVAGVVRAAHTTWAEFGDAARSQAHLGAPAPAPGVGTLTVLRSSRSPRSC